MPGELLPELIFDILLRLPAKSLLRFRCLSNSLCAEIDSSNFALVHLKRSIQTRSHRKLIFKNSEDYYSVDFDDELKKALNINNQFTDPEQYTTSIIGTCCGLILLRVYQNSSRPPEPGLFLWNPTTRQLKMLPSCENPSPGRGLSYGLGYDSVSDDYKVVRIVSDYAFLSSPTDFEPHHVWVFSLKLNSWRSTQDLHLHILILSSPIGFANGFLYWGYLGVGEGCCRKVGCFDFTNEVFIALPSFCSPQDGGLLEMVEMNGLVSTNIVVLEGNVLMHKGYRQVKADKFYSPVVDEVNALPGGNWIKNFSFEHARLSSRDVRVKPLAYSKDGAYVLLFSHNDVFWYNMEKKTRCEVECLSGISLSHGFDCRVIWESLLSLGNDGVFQV